MIEKIVFFKSLKIIDFQLNFITHKHFQKNILAKNRYIKKATIYLNNEDGDCIINDLLKKFPNLENLNLYIRDININKTDLEIKEEPDSKINKLSINIEKANKIKLNCHYFKNLIELNLNSQNEIIKLENSLPFFNINCKITFKSLIKFQFVYNLEYFINFKIINNLYNNIDKMPNLKYFSLNCRTRDLNEIFYNQFIKKIIGLKIEYINFNIANNNNINKELYSLKELKAISSRIKILEYDKIYIYKYNNN